MTTQLNLTATFYSKEQSTLPDGTVQPPATGEFGKTLKEALAGQGLLQCAVDPTVIALKTVFTLRLWDGQQVSAKALDIGTSIKGNKIDIYVDSNHEAIDLGVKSVTAFLDGGGGPGTGGRTYTVQPGDTLSLIAQKFYGDGSEQSWRKIYQANQAVIGPDPAKIVPGMVLTIP